MRLFLLLLLFRISEECSPFSMDNFAGNMGTIGVSSGTGARASGQSTVLGQETHNLALGTSSNPPITSADQLNCEDFDNTCRWRNMEGLFVDELDWFQGSGHLDQGRLQVATGTNVYPDGSYAIVATDAVQLPTAKAILVSDQIACQSGPGLLRFLYWTSPEVRIKVCAKPVARPFPEFSFCSPSIEAGDPGPATVQIPDQGKVGFQLFLVADNFVFRAVNLQGGFAIVDGVEYDATMCPPEIAPSQPEELELLSQNESPVTLFPTLGVRSLEQEKDAIQATSKPWLSFSPTITRKGPLPNTVMASLDRSVLDGSAQVRHDTSVISSEHNELTAMNNEFGEKAVIAACEALSCSFNDSQPCVQFATDSKWGVSNRPVGNPLTGIKGDASQLPFNKEGYFAFADGPRIFSRLTTAPFYLDRTSLFVFSYHKVDKSSRFRLFVKKAGTTEETLLFEAPRISKDARRWFREGRDLPEGQYDYLAFEIRELSMNNYIGVDEWMIVDENRRPFCSLPQ